MTAACVVCTAATDANLCGRCTRQLEEALGELPALLAELEVTITRQDRGTGTPLYAMSHRRLSLPGVHYDEGDSALPATAWPFSWDAANLAWTVRNTLLTWARHLAETRGVPFTLSRVTNHQQHGPICERHAHVRPDPGCGALAGACKQLHPGHVHRLAVPGCPPGCRRLHDCGHQSCAAIHRPDLRDTWNVTAWLLRNVDAIRLDEAAGEIHEAILGDRREIVRAIDRQDPDGYFGRCDQPDVRVIVDGDTLRPVAGICGAELFGLDGDAEIKCRHCGATYDAKARKRKLLTLLPDRVATVRVIADGLTKLDEPVTVDQITKWVERGQIPQRGADGKGHKLVRVGDVQVHLAALKERLLRPRTRRKITAA